MGLVYANIELRNGEDEFKLRRKQIKEDEVRKLDVQFLVDTGAIMLAINETIKSQLELEVISEDVAQLADGTSIRLDIVGPIEIRFENRRTMQDAFVLPGDSEPLFGVIPIEAMDILVDPTRHQLVVNPAHPLRPQFKMK